MRNLAQVFVPEGHNRYDGLLKWAETADDYLFRFGQSSDGRYGIWVAWSIWDAGLPRNSRGEFKGMSGAAVPPKTSKDDAA